MDIISAHAFSSNHREQIETIEVCGCFYCFAKFSPAEIVEWTDQGSTALCPRCTIDSVIGAASGVPLSDEFLRQMHAHWFDA